MSVLVVVLMVAGLVATWTLILCGSDQERRDETANEIRRD